MADWHPGDVAAGAGGGMISVGSTPALRVVKIEDVSGGLFVLALRGESPLMRQKRQSPCLRPSLRRNV